MGNMPRGEPRSVADPDAKPYNEMIRQHRALVARREQQEPSARSTLSLIEDTAELAAKELNIAQAVPDFVGRFTHDPEIVAAGKALKRFTGPLGASLSVPARVARYKADRAAGIPTDEALIRQGGGYLGNLLVDGALGPLSIVTARYTSKPIDRLAEQVARGWHDLKTPYVEGLKALNDPQTFLRPRYGSYGF